MILPSAKKKVHHRWAGLSPSAALALGEALPIVVLVSPPNIVNSLYMNQFTKSKVCSDVYIHCKSIILLILLSLYSIAND